jgi:hypothetical protein
MIALQEHCSERSSHNCFVAVFVGVIMKLSLCSSAFLVATSAFLAHSASALPAHITEAKPVPVSSAGDTTALIKPTNTAPADSSAVPADAMTLLWRGFEAYQAKNYFAVLRLVNEALQASRESRDAAGEAVTLYSLWLMYDRMGATELKEKTRLQADAALARVTDPSEATWCYLVMGFMTRKGGVMPRSREFFEEALTRSQALKQKGTKELREQ